MSTISEMPCWYVLIIILFSLCYGIREIVYRTKRLSDDEAKNTDKVIMPMCRKVIIFYSRDFLSVVICTISGFVALFFANYIFSKLDSFNDISAGTAIILIFLIFWGITGASGYLQYIIVAGKLPGFKPME